MHWAYYCAKHQLTDVQIDIYLTQEMNKMKSFKNDTWLFEYCLRTYPDRIKSILSDYEKVVCTD